MHWCTLLTCAAALLHPQPKAPAPLKATNPPSDELTQLRVEAAATDPLARLRLAIITHAQVYNSTDVDEDFVVPETWPQPLRGLELGAAVASLRRLEASAAADRRRHKSRTHKYSGEELRRDASSPRPSRTGWGRKLTQAGFDWAPRYVDGKHFAQIIKALKAYEDEHADLLLPRSFRVPAREPYPAALAGVDLDRAVYDLSFYRTFLAGRPERQQILRELGFCWGRLQPEFNLVIEALITFREWEGHLLVPAAFEVPRDDVRWPASTRGMPLGRRVRQIRRRNDYLGNDAARWRSLDELGFCWEPKKTKRSVAARALRRYEELQLNPAAPLADYAELLTKREVDWTLATVPRSFVIEEDDLRYPRECRGLALGARVAAYRRPLAKSRAGAFEAFFVELERYVAEGGSADVPQRFVTKAGYPLGTRVAQVRSRGQYLGGRGTQRFLDRRRRLDQLGFVWGKEH